MNASLLRDCCLESFFNSLTIASSASLRPSSPVGLSRFPIRRPERGLARISLKVAEAPRDATNGEERRRGENCGAGRSVCRRPSGRPIGTMICRSAATSTPRCSTCSSRSRAGWNAGEAVDEEQLAAEHPAWAREIRALLPTLRGMARRRRAASRTTSRRRWPTIATPRAGGSWATFASCARSAAAAWGSSTRPSRPRWDDASP